MLIALIAVVGSTVAGAVFALASESTRKLLGPACVFAFAAVTVAVVAHLLPEAIAGAGGWALVPFAAGLVAPTAIQRVAGRLSRARRSDAAIALELGFVGLLAHKVGDGFAVGVLTGPSHGDHGHSEILLAVAAHSAPITALIVFAFARRSLLEAGLRGAALAVAGAVGVVLAGVASPSLLASAEPWITATVAGLMLHILAHTLPAGGHRTRAVRAFEVVGLVAGVAISLAGGVDHGEGSVMAERVATAIVDITLEAAPMLVLGFAAAGAIYAWSARIPQRWLVGSPIAQALRGALLGAPVPVCSCGVLPIAGAFHARGAGAAFVMAVLIATPEIGVDTFIMTGQFFGWELAVVRAAAAIAVAIVAALVVSAMVVPRAPARASADADETGPFRLDSAGDPEPALRRALAGIVDLAEHILPWTIVGIAAAGFVAAMVPEGRLDGLAHTGLDIVVISLIAVPAYVCAVSATPLAAVLVAKGVSTGAVVAGLLLGAATNVATIGFLRRTFGMRATIVGLVSLVGATWIIALAINASPGWIDVAAPSTTRHESSAVGIASVVVLAGLTAWVMWSRGLAGLLRGLGLHQHDHGHDEHCDHAHDHGHGHGH